MFICDDASIPLALECRTRPHLHVLLLLGRRNTRHTDLNALPADRLLQALSAAEALLAAAIPRSAASVLIPVPAVLPLLLSADASVRAAAARIVAALVGFPDAARAALDKQWDIREGTSPPMFFAQHQAASSGVTAEALARTDEARQGALVACDGTTPSPTTTADFVSIPHAEAALGALSIALASGRPLLVSGPAGSGKSTLINELAHRLGQSKTLVRVHMDEQIDSKVLLGTYVCSEGAGEFTWQPGVVSQAVANGRWLLLEDVDRAPLEVMAALAPLLEGGSLYLPGRSSSLRPPSGFRLFGTVTIHAARASAAAAVARSVYRPTSWQHIHVPPPTFDDLTRIVARRYPLLAAAASSMVSTLFALVKGSAEDDAEAATEGLHAADAPPVDTEATDPMDTDEAGEGTDAAAAGAGAAMTVDAGHDVDREEAAGLEGARSALGSGRAISARDLLRWCARASTMLSIFGLGSMPALSSPHLTEQLREMVLMEALDVFVGAARKDGARSQLGARLAAFWRLPAERLNAMVNLHKPPIQILPTTLRIGRVTLPVVAGHSVGGASDGRSFAHTRQTLALMERVAACVRMQEAVLLVGETGTGKTTAVQYLAKSTGRQLLVHNLSEQSDASELVGGFRPVQLRHVFTPLAARFETAFCRTFSRAKNAALLEKLATRMAKGEWRRVLQLMSGALKTVYARIAQQADGHGSEATSGGQSKRQRTDDAAAVATASSLPSALEDEWNELSAEIARAQRQVEHPSEEGIAFAFVEGSLVRAIREGHWLLLDEMNLASAETLERVAAVLEEGGSITLTERGETDAVVRHPDFRIFGAMNPPTDFGKKELPPGIRARFTELYVSPLTSSEDLQLVILGMLQPVVPHPPVSAIVAFYHAAMAEAEKTLLDGANQRPQYSLRTLCRALLYTAGAVGSYGLERALWDGFHMTFVTQLQQRHQPTVEALMLSLLLPPKKGGGGRAASTHKPPPMHARTQAPSDGQQWVRFGGFFIRADPRGTPSDDAKYIVTPTVEARLQFVARMVAAQRFPVLLQGPTSAGKTSMVERLARATGHRLVRINNHEHTDVQEYIGSFQPGVTGKLEFCDGALTQAVRHGYWIVLDELNLAPSEVLEALNRLLDDNRELLLPETGEIVRPHPHFMLFATQNPPGSYGGRKVLSRAFRNRFVQLQMDEIPTDELAQILQKR